MVADPVVGFVPPPYPYDRLARSSGSPTRCRAASSTARSARRAIPVPEVAVRGRGRRARRRRWATRRRPGAPRCAKPRPAWIGRRFGVAVERRARRRVRRHQGARRVAAAPPAPAQPAARHRAVSRGRVSRATRWARCSPAAARCRSRSTREWHLDLDAIADADAERALRAVGQRARQPHVVGRPTRRTSREVADVGARRAASSSRATSATPSSRPSRRRSSSSGLDGVLAMHSVSKRSNLAGHARRLLRRRPRSRHVPRRDPQARRAHGADADAGRGGRRARRRRARRRCSAPATPSGARSCVDALAPLGLVHDGGAVLVLPLAARRRRRRRRLGDRGRSSRTTAGLLVAPGDLYGAAGADHVRLALVQPRDRFELAFDRLARTPSLTRTRRRGGRRREADHAAVGGGRRLARRHAGRRRRTTLVRSVIGMLDRGEVRVAEIGDGRSSSTSGRSTRS